MKPGEVVTGVCVPAGVPAVALLPNVTVALCEASAAIGWLLACSWPAIALPAVITVKPATAAMIFIVFVIDL
ncbi:MAG: hypothetical protein B7X09_06025, partial [Acidiphilium sp. 21-66-27]